MTACLECSVYAQGVHCMTMRPLARGTRWRVPRCIPSGHGAHPASSRTAPAKRAAVSSLVRMEPPRSLPTPAHGDRIRRSTATKAYAARGPRTMVSPMETTKGHSCPLDTRPTVRRLETVRSFRAPEPTTCDRFRFHLTSLEA